MEIRNVIGRFQFCNNVTESPLLPIGWLYARTSKKQLIQYVTIDMFQLGFRMDSALDINIINPSNIYGSDWGHFSWKRKVTI